MKPTDMLDTALLRDRSSPLEKGENASFSKSLPKPGPKAGQCMKRDFILCAASRVFYRDGFQGASIDLIASEAGVSRQTIYNHYRDKETLLTAVVDDAFDRMTASLFAVLATFPQSGVNLEEELIAFSIRMNSNCVYDSATIFLRKLFQSDEDALPLRSDICCERGPAQAVPAVAAHLSRLALEGELAIEDPDLAARHYFALINADIHYHLLRGQSIDDAIIEKSSINGVKTFLKAFGKR